jgi:uncharacterized protein (TIGR00369 family)
MTAQPRPFTRSIPFVELLGLELWAFDGGHAELRLEPRFEHQNSWGVAHGGVVMTMLDVAMAQAGRSAIERVSGATSDQAPGMVTIEMKTTFMRPAQGALRALGKLLHRSATMAFCEAQVLNAEGQLCAHATGTFKYLSAPSSRVNPTASHTKDSTQD